MKCRICGCENEDTNRYCKVCGAELKHKSEVQQTGIIKCLACGADNLAGASTCNTCGMHLKSQPSMVDSPAYQKHATVSMVLGIVALACDILCCTFLASLPLAIVSIVFGAKSVKDVNNRTQAIVGIVLSIISLVGFLVITISIIGVLSDPEFMEQIQGQFEGQQQMFNLFR